MSSKKQTSTLVVVGLGEIGISIGSLLRRSGFKVIGFDIEEEARVRAQKKGLESSTSLKGAIQACEGSTPRIIWLALTSDVLDRVVEELRIMLTPGDIIIDGSNSFFKETVRRHDDLLIYGINYVDVGLTKHIKAGGGALFELSVGCDKRVFVMVEHVLQRLTSDGYVRVGETGSGHLVKMVQHAVEYGVTTALAEGVSILENYKDGLEVDVPSAITTFKTGGLISHRVLDWLAETYKTKGRLSKISLKHAKPETEMEIGYIIKEHPTKVLEAASFHRQKLHLDVSAITILVRAMQNQFSGRRTLHHIKESEGTWGSATDKD